jgi:hypothetical protein
LWCLGHPHHWWKICLTQQTSMVVSEAQTVLTIFRPGTNRSADTIQKLTSDQLVLRSLTSWRLWMQWSLSIYSHYIQNWMWHVVLKRKLSQKTLETSGLRTTNSMLCKKYHLWLEPESVYFWNTIFKTNIYNFVLGSFKIKTKYLALSDNSTTYSIFLHE